MSIDPKELARRRREAARQALADTDAASSRLQDVRRRALRLLGEPVSGNAEVSSVDTLDARMREIERRMRETEAMIRRAEAGLERVLTDTSDVGDAGWTR